MNEYLSTLGKKVLAKNLYDILAKKRDLKKSGLDVGRYEYQAIQQRAIAVATIFDDLVTWWAIDSNNDHDSVPYYENLVDNQKPLEKFEDNGTAWEDYLTVQGLLRILEDYKYELIAKQAAWHDNIFENIPKIDSITDVKQCTVNSNYLERQQGYLAVFQSFKIPSEQVKYIEDYVHNSVYKFTLKQNGAADYVCLAHYAEREII